MLELSIWTALLLVVAPALIYAVGRWAQSLFVRRDR